jgi:serine phosphatase RsbU (regulator of sigma subunit)
VFHHKNGTAVYAERTGSVVNVDGRDMYLASMRDVTSERRRQAELSRDFEFARRTQKGLLPVVTDSEHVGIRTLYYPLNFVSGDAYNLEWRKDGCLLRGFLIDVSGHGLATAIQTSSINVLLREAANSQLSLLGQIELLNARATQYFTEDAYAAIIGFELDLSRRELRYIGAGITQFYANSEKIKAPGMFVGIWNDAEFEMGTINFELGDSFYFLTDGFTDALSQPQSEFSWSPGGKEFATDLAALEQLAESGTLRDDASAICLQIKKFL